MPFNFNTTIPTYQPHPFNAEEHRNATETFFYPQPLPPLDEEEETPQQQPIPDPDNLWNTEPDPTWGQPPSPTFSAWHIPAEESWYPHLRHGPIAIDLQYPSPPPSPKPDNQRFPLSPTDLVRHYLFDPHHTDIVNIQRLRSCSPYPKLVKLVLRHTFWNPEHAAPLFHGLRIVLELPYTPYINRHIRHKHTLHAHFAPFPEDPFCTCACCLYCPLHPFKNASHPHSTQATN